MFWKQKTKLKKILYIVPDGDESAGERETLWAHSLGNGLYELQNIPFYSLDLNIGDVVRCAEQVFRLPTFKEVVKRSGNQTLRVIFTDETSDDLCIDIILELEQKGVFNEKVLLKQYMFNIPPDVDYNWVKIFLKQKESQGFLWLYE